MMPPELAAKIRAQIQRDTKPVKPMMAIPAYTLLFLAVAAAISVLYAALLSFKGLHALPCESAIALLLTLALSAIVSSFVIARSMRPASGRLPTWLLFLLALIAYEALTIRLFSDYSTTLFIHSGVLCFFIGSLCGLLVAAPIWLAARRGFVVQPALSGAAIGLVGGLAGLAALTLHCAILTVPHTAVWHAAVLVLCTALGALIPPKQA